MNWWPWTRRSPEPTADARHAVEQAERQLADTERLSSRIDEVAAELHEIQRRNHFGEAVELAWSRRRAHP